MGNVIIAFKALVWQDDGTQVHISAFSDVPMNPESMQAIARDSLATIEYTDEDPGLIADRNGKPWRPRVAHLTGGEWIFERHNLI